MVHALTMPMAVLTMPWVSTPSDGVSSPTLDSQLETERLISTKLTEHMGTFAVPTLDKGLHLSYLTGLIRAPLSMYFTALDASRPWLVYWVLHSYALLECELDPLGRRRVVDTLARCQNSDGGFGGGPGQMSHLAPSYAAMLALAYVGEDGLKMVNRCAEAARVCHYSDPDSLSQARHVQLPALAQAAGRVVHHARRRRG